MTNTTALHNQIASLNANQSDETLLDSWIRLVIARLDATIDQAPVLRVAMDSIEAELTSRGMTAEQFDALFLATIDAHDAELGR